MKKSEKFPLLVTESEETIVRLYRECNSELKKTALSCLIGCKIASNETVVKISDSERKNNIHVLK